MRTKDQYSRVTNQRLAWDNERLDQDLIAFTALFALVDGSGWHLLNIRHTSIGCEEGGRLAFQLNDFLCTPQDLELSIREGQLVAVDLYHRGTVLVDMIDAAPDIHRTILVGPQGLQIAFQDHGRI